MLAGCLRRFGVRRVALLVVTHLHADHVGGVSALRGRLRPGRMVLSPVRDDQTVRVPAVLRGAEPVAVGDAWQVGPARLDVVSPPADVPAGVGSAANQQGVVLLVARSGVRCLFTGDLEREAQVSVAARLRGAGPVGCLKVPHHGSGNADPEFAADLGVRFAVISVGRDNTYGHPHPATLRRLQEAGAVVFRTDQSGDVWFDEDGRWRTAR